MMVKAKFPSFIRVNPDVALKRQQGVLPKL